MRKKVTLGADGPVCLPALTDDHRVSLDWTAEGGCPHMCIFEHVDT
ncbi:MAG: hypothetical protein WB660_19940 [Candidatus Sulfotelmatobacter sp.]